MSVSKDSNSGPNDESEVPPQPPSPTTYHPAPSMLWFVLPLLLLMLYGYLSR